MIFYSNLLLLIVITAIFLRATFRLFRPVFDQHISLFKKSGSRRHKKPHKSYAPLLDGYDVCCICCDVDCFDCYDCGDCCSGCDCSY